MPRGEAVWAVCSVLITASCVSRRSRKTSLKFWATTASWCAPHPPAACFVRRISRAHPQVYRFAEDFHGEVVAERSAGTARPSRGTKHDNGHLSCVIQPFCLPCALVASHAESACSLEEGQAG